MKLIDFATYSDFGEEWYLQVLSFYPRFALFDIAIQWDDYPATDVLEFLCKASKTGTHYDLNVNEDGDYIIVFTWYYEDKPEYGKNYYYRKVKITKEGNGDCSSGFVSFDCMMDDFNMKLEEMKQQQIKAQKRKELIARLTDEEKELLGL